MELRLRILGARSLKEKRKVLRSVKDRFSRMNISISETEDQDKWQAATLGFAVVSNDANFINSILDKITLTFIDNSEIEILNNKIEIVHL